jgi:hypothetical protein
MAAVPVFREVHEAVTDRRGRDRRAQGVRTMNTDFTAVVQKVSGGYIAFVEECPGTGIYGNTFEETLYGLEAALEPLRTTGEDGFHILAPARTPILRGPSKLFPGRRRSRTRRVCG